MASYSIAAIQNTAAQIKDYCKEQMQDLLSRCAKTGQCPNKTQVNNFIAGITEAGIKKYASSNLNDTELKSVRNRISFYSNVLYSMYRSYAVHTKITDSMPTSDNSTVSKTSSTVIDPVDRSPVSEWARTNVSFSGGDMIVTASIKASNGTRLEVAMGALQTISYSIYQQKTPIYGIGNINAKDYVMGTRVIAGSMVFAVFNQHWGADIMQKFAEAEGYASNQKFLMDEIAPIDLTVSMINEYGIYSRLAIYSIRLFSEGMVMSINDVYTENTYQYVALNVDYLADETSEDNPLVSAKSNKSTASSNTESPVAIKPAEDGGATEDTSTNDATDNNTVDENITIADEMKKYVTKTSWIKHLAEDYYNNVMALKQQVENKEIGLLDFRKRLDKLQEELEKKKAAWDTLHKNKG